MELIKIKIDDLKPASYNPRKDLKPADSEYQKIKRSIMEFGYVDPIIVNSDMTVIGGHQKLKVLKELEYPEVDCVVVDLNKIQEKALNIALNKISGEWNMPLLKNVLKELDLGIFDVNITGFDEIELDDIFGNSKSVEEDDFDLDEALKEIKEPVTKFRDIWQLGGHRLMCGDSTVLDDIRKLMAGKHADMVFTDPPYNVNYEGKTADGLTILNDKMKDKEFYKFLFNAYTSMFVVTNKGGPVYICYAESEGLNFRKALKDTGWELKQCIIWVKNSFVMGRQDYQWKHEAILYGWKTGGPHPWYADRKQSTVMGDDCISIKNEQGQYLLTINIDNRNIVLKVPSYEVLDEGDDSDKTIWYINKPLRNADHPTMKPVKIPARAIMNSSQKGEIILDIFGGSGSTLIAAEETDRICYMMELDPRYCDVIIQRWEKFTGKKAELIKGD
jgi:DNA modification methylase